MIPTLLVLGVVFGHWWKTALLVGTVGWAVLLGLDPDLHLSGSDLLLSALLGFGNTAVGVAAHQVLRLLWHRVVPEV